MAVIELDQACETPISVYRRGVFYIRYAYARAKDARLSNLRGEDYLVFRVEPEWLAFAVCDGVGSSFFGGLAAQIIGERLLTWMAKDETRKMLDENPPAEIVDASLRKFLNRQVVPSSQVIARKDITSLPNPFVRSAYQEKREKHGSQSNFVCGLVVAKSKRAWLFSLGDASLRAWKGEDEYSLDLPHSSEQSWSTKHGVTGNLHFRTISLDDADTLIAYSDGLNQVEKRIKPQIPASELETIILDLGADPKSDDISFLEIKIASDATPSLDDIVNLVRGTSSVSSQPVVPAPAAPKKHFFGWLLGATLFFSGLLIGILSGYNLQRFLLPVDSQKPFLTATSSLNWSSDTPVAHTPTTTSTITPTIFATSTETFSAASATENLINPLMVSPTITGTTTNIVPSTSTPSSTPTADLTALVTRTSSVTPQP